ncbi:GATA transcription factor 6-like [Lolium rigidum]|uniref:GATA transcription factor 6-like n=1 Tax=Lolium rigidum TaxID=89674 RepID=UPI001F5C9CDD|nr:GATA transcription factor 6-like [Lolium rigidum]
MPSYAHHHSSLDERMDALKGSSRHDESADEAAAAADAPAAAAWGFADKEGFSVEDLLDLEEFCDGEGEADAKDVPDEHEAPPAAAAAAKQDRSNNDGSQQSVVSFDLAPPAPEIVDLPAHDAEELEWVSRIMDDSLSELPPQPAPPASMMAARPPPYQHRQQHLLLQQRRPQDGAYRALPMPSACDQFRTPTICALSTEALVPVKAKRSKRSRASAWSLSGAPHDSASSSSTTSSSSSSSASFSPYFLLGGSDHHLLLDEYSLLGGPPPPPSKKSKHGKSGKPKKRGRKPKHLPPSHPGGGTAGSPGPNDRRCSHCGVQKTPQWRAGPAGAKTLCNACGVRYKSGRLLPEYRPACSPTYVSTVHSNSHRKVLEMRRKKEDGPLYLTGAAGVANTTAVPSF